jgi:AcrR family transcriptional regulator
MEKTKKQFQSERSKEQIIKAAMHLLAVRGYGNTSISDLSAATGLTKGALYHHFRDKEEIFYTTIDAIGSILKERLMIKDNGSYTTLQKLGHLVDSFVRLFEENNQYILIMSGLFLEMADSEDTFAQPLVELFSELSHYIERIIVKGQSAKEISQDLDAKLLSLNILGMLLGNTMPWILNKDRINYEAMMDIQKEILIRSLKTV